MHLLQRLHYSIHIQVLRPIRGEFNFYNWAIEVRVEEKPIEGLEYFLVGGHDDVRRLSKRVGVL
jgi:hypothetical protein